MKKVTKILLLMLVSCLFAVSLIACDFGGTGGDNNEGPYSVTIETSGEYNPDYCQIDIIDYYASAAGEAIMIESGEKVAKGKTIMIVFTNSFDFKTTSCTVNGVDKMSEFMANSYAAILHKVESDTVIKANYVFEGEFEQITGAVFKNQAYVYDGEAHYAKITVPSSVAAKITLVGDESGEEFDGAIEVGTYYL